MYNWKWYLSELKQDKDVTVFSCFSCGGGSTMGYKRAGFKVLGNVEIDPRVNEVYKTNNHPKYNYLMDLRDFNKLQDLPDELYHLDILDGSPPCSTFSTAGLREKVWGKEKAFREGQKKQVLDDLFFVFLDTVEKLKPKIVVAENVTGIIKGNAKGYVNLILKRFKELGYEVQLFKLNAALMDVPQTRERVFFIANNQGYPQLKLNFHNKPILFGEVRSEHGIPYNGAYVKDSKSRRIAKINEYINNNYMNPIKLCDIAQLVSMSDSALSHFFKKRTNRNIVDYINDIRISNATKMLFETTNSISEIAFLCGFNNISNFNRIFKKNKGKTPSEYRESIQKIMIKY